MGWDGARVRVFKIYKRGVKVLVGHSTLVHYDTRHYVVHSYTQQKGVRVGSGECIEWGAHSYATQYFYS